MYFTTVNNRCKLPPTMVVCAAKKSIIEKKEATLYFIMNLICLHRGKK